MTKQVVLRPPILEGKAAKESYRRLQRSSSGELAEWFDRGVEEEFAELHPCESALLVTLICHKLERWQDVCAAGESFLDAVDELMADATSLSRKRQCRTNAGYLIEIMGRSYCHLDQFQLAAVCFETAIELNPHVQTGYLHWAELAQRLGMRELSARIIDAGLRKIPNSPELRMYQQAVTNRQTVSVCMIVKDEESFLEGCLLSIRDIADEIILVDTGSTDKTIEIAESFGCKIFHQPWEGDFSKHRNYSIEQASSDWIFIIDADERLIEQDVPRLKEYLQKSEFDLLSLTVYNVAERSGKDTTVLPSVRIFRRDLDLQYKGIVHNRLNYTSEMKELRCPVGLRHHGYDLSPEKMKLKHKRSFELLRKQIEQDEKNAFAHFNLAQLVRARGNLESANDCRTVITHAKRVIELTEPSSMEFGSIHLMAYHQLATAHYALAEYEPAMEACLNALKIDGSYLDCVITLAHIYRRQERYSDAAKRYTEYLELQQNYSEHQQTNTLIMIHLNSRANAYYNLGLVEEAQQNYTEALGKYRQALTEEPDYLDANTRAGWTLYRLANHDEAQQYFRRDIEAHPERDSAYLGLAETFVTVGDLAGAEATLRNGLNATAAANPILCRYSDLLVDTSRANEALELLANSKSVVEDAATLAAQGRVELALVQVEKARESFIKSEQLAPGDSRVSAGLADANLMLENNTEACVWYEKALAADPHSAHLLRNHAIALARTGRLSAAIERLTEYTPIAPDDRESRFILGALLLKENRGAEALQVYEVLLREEPTDQEALLALSDCYLSLGVVQAAEVGYQRLLKVDPSHGLAKERLSSIEQQRGQLVS